jgi:hypothetical protein
MHLYYKKVNIYKLTSNFLENRACMHLYYKRGTHPVDKHVDMTLSTNFPCHYLMAQPAATVPAGEWNNKIDERDVALGNHGEFQENICSLPASRDRPTHQLTSSLGPAFTRCVRGGSSVASVRCPIFLQIRT